MLRGTARVSAWCALQGGRMLKRLWLAVGRRMGWVKPQPPSHLGQMQISISTPGLDEANAKVELLTQRLDRALHMAYALKVICDSGWPPREGQSVSGRAECARGRGQRND